VAVLANVSGPLSKLGANGEVVFTIESPAASRRVSVPLQVVVVQVSPESVALAATPFKVSTASVLLPETIAYDAWFSASTVVPLSISTANVWAEGTPNDTDQLIVQPEPLLTVALQVVVEPAGVVAPSMKSAARVVPAEIYERLRDSLAAPGLGGTTMVTVPYAVKAGASVARACTAGRRTAPELPPAHEFKQNEMARTIAGKRNRPVIVLYCSAALSSVRLAYQR
jgi:hypothetical protein